MKRITLLLICLLLLTMTACSENGAATAETSAEPAVLNMEDVYNNMVANENMPEMLLLDPDMQLNFCGIDPADCVQANVAICADSLRADEIWLIEAASDAALENIQNLAQARLTAKAEESITYSPEQYAIVQKAEVITCGNYFVLLVSPEVETLAELFCAAANI